MKFLLLGSDKAKADAYRRAADSLAACEIAGQAASGALQEAGRLLKADRLSLILLEPLSDALLDLLIQTKASAIYDPPVFDASSRLRAAAESLASHNLWFSPVLPLRLLPVARRIRAHVASGTLGQLLYMKLTYNERPPVAERSMTSALIQRGGSAFDILRWLLGDDIADVQIARASSAQRVDDIAILSIVMRDKAYATADISWSLPRGYPKPAAITIEIAGTGGSIRSDVLNQTAELYTSGAMRSLNWGSDWHVEALRALAAAEAGEAPPCTLEQLIWAQSQVERLL